MGRIRSIKPDFFLDADVATLDPLCRLFYQGLWLHADKAGRLRDNSLELKVRILPYDNVDCEAFLERLAQPKTHSARKRPFIIRYENAGLRLIQIVSLLEHQIINPYTEAKSPPLPENPHAAVVRRAEKKRSGSGACDINPPPPPPAAKPKRGATRADLYHAVVTIWNDAAQKNG
ncbi:MAG: hypothetical protein AAB964_01320, partial [Patescibacteria group bacterium]